MDNTFKKMSQSTIHHSVRPEPVEGYEQVYSIPNNAQSKKTYTIKDFFNNSMHQALTITIESGASAVINFCSEPKNSIDKSITIVVQDYAQLTCVYDECIESGVQSTVHSIYQLGASSSLELFFVSTVLGSSSHALDVLLNGAGASARVQGVTAAGLSAKSECITTQKHNASDTTSNLVVHSVGCGNSQTLYQGNIYIDKTAYRTDAAQKNKALLIAHSARARSIPGLEVLNNDVQCRHGSAIGQFDEDQLWYLQSRGINVKVAQELLLQGFVQDLLPKSEIDKNIVRKICKIIYKQEV